MNYYQKYQKYKNKYFELKGGVQRTINYDDLIDNFFLKFNTEKKYDITNLRRIVYELNLNVLIPNFQNNRTFCLKLIKREPKLYNTQLLSKALKNDKEIFLYVISSLGSEWYNLFIEPLTARRLYEYDYQPDPYQGDSMYLLKLEGEYGELIYNNQEIEKLFTLYPEILQIEYRDLLLSFINNENIYEYLLTNYSEFKNDEQMYLIALTNIKDRYNYNLWQYDVSTNLEEKFQDIFIVDPDPEQDSDDQLPDDPKMINPDFIKEYKHLLQFNQQHLSVLLETYLSMPIEFDTLDGRRYTYSSIDSIPKPNKGTESIHNLKSDLLFILRENGEDIYNTLSFEIYLDIDQGDPILINNYYQLRKYFFNNYGNIGMFISFNEITKKLKVIESEEKQRYERMNEHKFQEHLDKMQKLKVIEAEEKQRYERMNEPKFQEYLDKMQKLKS